MELLASYDDEDEDERVDERDKKAAALRSDVCTAFTASSLPPPNFDGSTEMMASTIMSGERFINTQSNKRPLPVQAHGILQQGISKAQKNTTSQMSLKPGNNPKEALLLPPQLRGRSNVSTEDLDRLFTRKHKEDASVIRKGPGMH
ncbi:hypothetical protein CEUSTIGMA_g4107.t1 [Chlamydomonas eustigma]|uniref:Uncharacterized protein n=1 Tax=Chlamydomonas eustigma TaxID=1157962 RepID=A0A250X0Q1_9CHLO|nr:hypothetical protein CEUSTIGMA_g4107.t1 [Chlamydomonas eustigma]|eukprot:GAX76661.1 hypothetical protein CEUSTIGMA_g4107.t1 [Chlamydomonas eustigma]